MLAVYTFLPQNPLVVYNSWSIKQLYNTRRGAGAGAACGDEGAAPQSSSTPAAEVHAVGIIKLGGWSQMRAGIDREENR